MYDPDRVEIEPAVEPPQKFQFTLKDLFLIMFATGCAMAVSVKIFKSPGAGAVFGVFVAVGGLIASQASRKIRSRKGRILFTLFGMAVMWFVALTAYTYEPHTNQGVRTKSNAGAEACIVYAESQELYRSTDWNGDGVLEYAQQLVGTDSLFETTGGTADIGLIDRAVAYAQHNIHGRKAKGGYFFKILTAQGVFAPGGARSYLDSNGRMVGGHALVAIPATYPTGARNTYIISNSGTLYRADLGPNSQAIGEAMTVFDPDPAVWSACE